MRFILAVAVSVSLAVGLAFGAASTRSFGNIERIEIPWTSNASGAFTESIPLHCVILRVVTDPGSTAPTDNYDVTLVDEFGLDLLAGQGANRDTTTTEAFCPGAPLNDGTTTSVLPIGHLGNATLTIANAGDSKTGTVVIFCKTGSP